VRFSRELSVVYEDEAVVALNKPPGLPSVPITSSQAPSALTLLAEALKPKRQRAMVVHRIDRFTSGILLFAKTNADRDALIRQFLKHTPKREYLAVVRGEPKEREGTLVHYLRRAGMFQKVSSEADPEAARAELRYKVERPLRGASLVRVWLVTGLQNQIRAQFAAIGNPVIGDRKYRPEEAEETRISRAALHATRIEFIHPRTQKPLAIDCDPPGDFQSLVGGLTRKGSKRRPE
jgi:23S rRNA pseudouridine1911/1915/1917 synthase